MVKNVFIPEALDIKRLIIASPPVINGFSVEKLLLVISFISEVSFSNDENISAEGFVRIHSKILQSHVHDYKAYLNYLEDNDVIKIDRHYRVGEKCRGYRFADKYNSKVVEEWIEIKTFGSRRNTKKLTSAEARTLFKHIYLSKWIDLITIDYEAARSHLESEAALLSNDDSKSLNSFNSGIISISKINNKEFYWSIDSTSNRFHSNLTNLNSNLRRFIRYNNKPLVSYDIKNSQLYFVLALLSQTFYTPGNKLNINKLNIKSIRNPEIKEIVKEATIMLENLKKTPNSVDINFYKKLVSDGKLYDELVIKAKEQTIKQLSDRSKVKHAIFLLLFSNDKPWQSRPSQFKRLFMSVFPSIWGLFKIIKRRHHNSLAIILQRIESYMVIDIICKKIARIDSNIPLYTIHDSIATTEEYSEIVNKVIYEKLTEYIGIPPTLKTEYWQ
jgi:hypothetical protein